MSLKCPKNCSSPFYLVRFGSFYRTSDSKHIRRWRCKNCGATVSSATYNPCFGQKKRRLNRVIGQKILGKTAQRRIALMLGINRKTVARKIKFLGLLKHTTRVEWLKSYTRQKITHVQFDDMITMEHTKCKPVAISLMVEEGTRKILDFEVSPVAANGLLAKISRKKYGLRVDGRQKAWNKIFERSKEYLDEKVQFKSDEHPFYPRLVRTHFPKAKHLRYKGRRGCVVGQGELKSGGFDPLFSLNHTCAMIRDSLGRLVRRTWCTTKRLDSLRDQLEIYIDYHNQVLTS